MTPFELYEFAKEDIPGIVFKYCSIEKYEAAKVGLEHRF